MFRIILFFIISALLFTCSDSDDRTNNPSMKIINKSIEAYGYQNFLEKQVSFMFRGKKYLLEITPQKQIYRKKFEDKSATIIEETLINSTSFERRENGKLTLLPDTIMEKYKNSLNSVLYFFQLPLPLNDEASIKKYEGITKIKGKEYHQIKITFEEENGGKDHEDVYLYWINKKSFHIDYFAYKYQVNGGGLRFREAINKRKINDFLFQDYINYRPKNKKNEDIENSLDYFKSGKLEKISRIENKAIAVDG